MLRISNIGKEKKETRHIKFKKKDFYRYYSVTRYKKRRLIWGNKQKKIFFMFD